jgi:hypothetical protein
MKNLIYLFLFLALTISLSAQWQSDVRLTNDPLLSYTSFGNARCVAVNGDVVHVVWYSGDTVGVNGWDIFYKRSTDKGTTWSTPVNLSGNGLISYNPAIAVSGQDVHVVWYGNGDGNYEEYYNRSTDGGITWGTKVRLTNAPNSSAHGSIAASGSNVHFVWMDYRNGKCEVFYKNSVDAGVTWSADLLLNNSGGKSYMPAVAVSGSVVHVVWCDSISGNWKVYYKRSADGGLTWGADMTLSSNALISKYVTLAASGSNVHLVWIDIRVNSLGYMYYKRSVDGGINWGAETKVSKNTFNNMYPSLAVNNSVLHLTFIRPVKTNWELFYVSSGNNGTKWGTEVQLTNNVSHSEVPSIAVSGSNVHIIYRNTRDGNYEIYYKRNLNAQSGPLAVSQLNSEIPNAYSLSQNYPNPFNPGTVISYQLPVNSFVTLKIYDILGKEVTTLVNQEHKAGTYQVDWNAGSYSSGVYYYKLTAGDFVETKKMMLVK